MKTPVYIPATGYFFPEGRITNDQLVATLPTTHEWIMSHVGIRERRAARRDQRPSDLGVLASRDALQKAGWSADDVDLLVCATTTPDALAPATACYMGMKLGIDPVAFDVGAACSGFVYALQVTAGMIAQGGYRRALCVATEDYTRLTDYTNRQTCIFFGDSAGVALMQAEQPDVGLELVDVLLVNVNEGVPYVGLPINGFFSQVGNKVLDYATKCFLARSTEMLERHGLKPADLRAFVGHQANLIMLEQVANTLGLRQDQHWHNVEWCGNQGCAGVASTLALHLEQQRDSLKHGDWFLLTTFGAGFTTGSALLRWIDTRG